MTYLASVPFDDIEIGQYATITKTLTSKDIAAFALLTGDMNPAHVDEEFAKDEIFGEVVAHGMWGASLLSSVLGTKLPGPGTIYLEQTLQFLKPVLAQDHITAKVVVKDKIPKNKILVLACSCENQRGEMVISGQAKVIAPKKNIILAQKELGSLKLQKPVNEFYYQLYDAAADKLPLKTAVIFPTSKQTWDDLIQMHEHKLIDPIIVAPTEALQLLGEKRFGQSRQFEHVDVENHKLAVDAAVQLALTGKVDALLNGFVDTQAFILDDLKQKEFFVKPLMSHILVFDMPGYHKRLYFTDAVVNVDPNLSEKKQIIENAIEVFRTIEHREPKVALVCALPRADNRFQSTLDAAKLCELANHGAFDGAMVDGPFTFDVAINGEAAYALDIHSTVAGDADIVIMPNLECGNIFYKHLRYLMGVEAASVVVGGRCPIILPSRASHLLTRKNSCLLGCLLAK